jgi:hypothetical protein
MALIPYAAPATEQPQGATPEIDWANPLNEGAGFSAPLSDGFSDIVGGTRSGTINGTVLEAPTAEGRGAKFDGSSYLDYGSGDLISSTSPFTITLYEETDTTGSYNSLLAFSAGVTRFVMYRGTAAGYTCVIGPLNGGATVREFNSLGAQTAGEKKRFVITGTGGLGSATGLRLWADGVEQTSGTSNLSAAGGNNTIGWGGVNSKFNGKLSDVNLYARVWTDEEITRYFECPGQVYRGDSVLVPISVGGGGASGTSATTNASDTSSAGGTTTVTGTSSRTNANDTSSASGTTTVVGTSAKTNANDASSASGTTTVIGTLAKTNADDTSAASGTVGSSGTTGTVAATNANDTAAASGTTKIVGTLSTTNANDAATASGVAGAVSGTVAVTNANDTASAVGDAGAPVASGAGMGFSMSRMRRLVKIQFNGKLYQAFEEDIPELLETLEEQAEQKIKKKRNARAKPAPVATVVSAPADVLPSLQSRIDDVNHSIGVLWGVDEDEDEELLWLML